MKTLVFAVALLAGMPVMAAESFNGRYYSGSGDREYLELLDMSRRMMGADPEFQNFSMLYYPRWNGLVEGPTWDAWWIQNSYGTTLCALPVLEEPFTTFLQNSQDLWFDQMGDGKHAGEHGWIGPDGCLCDCARPGWIMFKQGDGRIDIHDWALEFTAAGIIMQTELLLISRDVQAANKYLPMLERCAAFIETRRDPAKNAFLCGPAANLLAPSYAGYQKSDGTFGQSYLTGLSVTYIAALDRLIELEKLAGRTEQADKYARLRATAREGLKQFFTDEGYLVQSIEPDGTRHGVYGAPRHGYLETSPNHDAIALRVADDAQSRRIYDKIASIPELRPHAFMLPNYPSYDDLYTKPDGLWAYGFWVNGGAWSTCEARAMMAYSRLGKTEDCRKSMRQLMKFVRTFKMDNPLTKMGDDVYQPANAINLCYDSFGPTTALMRGLFEYLYSADSLTLIPHIPAQIERMDQRFPVRFGKSSVYISTAGKGPVTQVKVNGRVWDCHTTQSITLPAEGLTSVVLVGIGLGNTEAPDVRQPEPIVPQRPAALDGISTSALAALDPLTTRVAACARFRDTLTSAGLSDSYEWHHADLVVEAWNAAVKRIASPELEAQLNEPARSAARDQYIKTVGLLATGLESAIAAPGKTDPSRKSLVTAAWNEAHR